MKRLLTIIVLIGFSLTSFSQNKKQVEAETIKIAGSDNLEIYADTYFLADDDSPIILLFHQARYSRGEYLEIAPKLNMLGFSCIAIDQRSGDEINDIRNMTEMQASDLGLGTVYVDAYPDLIATLNYTMEKYPKRKIIVWGSSYSASLNFILANEHSDKIAALIAFSPGEYFTYKEKTIADYALGVKCPCFITSAKNEESSWKNIYNKLTIDEKVAFIPEEDGIHGSKALWNNNPNSDEYWLAVISFLKQFRN